MSPSHQQPRDYYSIIYDTNQTPIVVSFHSNIPDEMENPHIYGLTWQQVQKTLNNYYKELSKVYIDISNDWLDKTEDEYFFEYENNDQQEMWDKDLW